MIAYKDCIKFCVWTPVVAARASRDAAGRT